MALYDLKENQQNKKTDQLEFLNEIQYPDLPLIEPLCKSKQFKLSELYIVFFQHIRKAIDDWFSNKGKRIDLAQTVWVLTVPAIAGPKQKEFMRTAFVDGMGMINNQKILDKHIFCVLEPEAAFLYAL